VRFFFLHNRYLVPFMTNMGSVIASFAPTIVVLTQEKAALPPVAKMSPADGGRGGGGLGGLMSKASMLFQAAE